MLDDVILMVLLAFSMLLLCMVCDLKMCLVHKAKKQNIGIIFDVVRG